MNKDDEKMLISGLVEAYKKTLHQVIKENLANETNETKTVFIKNVLLNFTGQVVLSVTNPVFPGAFLKNTTQILCELQQWFDMAAIEFHKNSKERH